MLRASKSTAVGSSDSRYLVGLRADLHDVVSRRTSGKDAQTAQNK